MTKRSVSVRKTVTTTYTLDEDDLRRILLEHLGLQNDHRVSVEIDCGYDVLREVVIRKTEEVDE